MRIAMSLAVPATRTVPAAAHVGEHTGMSLSQLASHVFETDHIVFATIAVAVGILAYRAGRRAEARAIAVRSKDDRS